MGVVTRASRFRSLVSVLSWNLSNLPDLPVGHSCPLSHFSARSSAVLEEIVRHAPLVVFLQGCPSPTWPPTSTTFPYVDISEPSATEVGFTRIMLSQRVTPTSIVYNTPNAPAAISTVTLPIPTAVGTVQRRQFVFSSFSLDTDPVRASSGWGKLTDRFLSLSQTSQPPCVIAGGSIGGLASPPAPPPGLLDVAASAAATSPLSAVVAPRLPDVAAQKFEATASKGIVRVQHIDVENAGASVAAQRAYVTYDPLTNTTALADALGVSNVAVEPRMGAEALVPRRSVSVYASESVGVGEVAIVGRRCFVRVGAGGVQAGVSPHLVGPHELYSKALGVANRLSPTLHIATSGLSGLGLSGLGEVLQQPTRTHSQGSAWTKHELHTSLL